MSKKQENEKNFIKSAHDIVDSGVTEENNNEGGRSKDRQPLDQRPTKNEDFVFGLKNWGYYSPERVDKFLEQRLFKEGQKWIREDVMSEFDRIGWGQTFKGSNDQRVTIFDHSLARTRLMKGEVDYRVLNFGRSRTNLSKICWAWIDLNNAALGTYGTKASTAMASEESNFDNSFYRMHRRDKDLHLGYLLSSLVKQHNRTISWLREGLSHTAVRRMFFRNLMNRKYGENLGSVLEYERLLRESEREGRQEDVRQLKGILKTADSFGIVDKSVSKESVHGGIFSKYSLYGYDQLLDEVHQHADGRSNVYVIKAKDQSELFSELLAAWTGTLSEFNFWEKNILFICAYLRREDLERIFKDWGLIYRSEGSLERLVHFLKFQKKMKYRYGWYRIPFGDLCRIRDILAHSCVEVKNKTTENWVRVGNTGYGDMVLTVPMSDWRNRLCHCYQILELRGEDMVQIYDWPRLEQTVINRAAMIGWIIDYCNQITIGHWANIRYIVEQDMVMTSLNILLDYYLNVFYRGNERYLLGIHCDYVGYEFLEGSEDYEDGSKFLMFDLEKRERPIVLDEGEEEESYSRLVTTPFQLSEKSETTDCWYICRRANWHCMTTRHVGELIRREGRRLFGVEDRVIDGRFLDVRNVEHIDMCNLISNGVGRGVRISFDDQDNIYRDLKVSCIFGGSKEYIHWATLLTTGLDVRVKCNYYDLCVSTDEYYCDANSDKNDVGKGVARLLF
jgi:hypothetical protein